jgi:hypothetical protein
VVWSRNRWCGVASQPGDQIDVVGAGHMTYVYRTPDRFGKIEHVFERRTFCMNRHRAVQRPRLQMGRPNHLIVESKIAIRLAQIHLEPCSPVGEFSRPVCIAQSSANVLGVITASPGGSKR